jgi:hypothetical protein
VNRRDYRIYLRASLPFILTLSVLFLAVLFAIAFLDTLDRSRFALALPTLALFALAYLLHKASLSWIRISDDGNEIVSVPSWYSRKLLGERRLVGRIGPESELLFCRKSAYGAFDGYYVILRTPDTSDLVLWNAESGISRRIWERAAKEIGELHQLKTRLVRQVVGNQGTQETEWTAKSDKLMWKNATWLIGPALFSWLGIPVRLLTPDPWKIAFVGVFLWIVGVSVYWFFYRSHQVAKEQNLAITTLLWTLQFGGLYTVTALATNAFLHG